MNCRKELADVTRTATLKEFVAESIKFTKVGRTGESQSQFTG